MERTLVRVASRLVTCLAFQAALAVLAAPAFAQPTLAVLGLSSETADEEVARALTDKLRAKAAGSPQWTLSSTGASLDQMMMVHDCEAADTACLAETAKGLDVEQLIYGKIERESGTKALHAEVNLYAPPGGRSASADIEDPKALDAVATDLVRQLSAAPEPEPTAAAAAVEPTPAPLEAAPEAEPTPADSSPTSLKWLGYTLVGVSIASVGVAVYSWVRIDSAGDNAAFRMYRQQAGAMDPMASDVCVSADSGLRYGVDEATFAQVRDQCSAGHTFEVLQYVFLGAAVVSGGIGAYILLTDDDASDSASTPRRLALRPMVGAGSASLTATLAF